MVMIMRLVGDGGEIEWLGEQLMLGGAYIGDRN